MIGGAVLPSLYIYPVKGDDAQHRLPYSMTLETGMIEFSRKER